MSFKGISWAGNVYEKFEAMCLEVEEAMYQDTVKYMENQVQKVGVSVKKFCSEVMEDMSPISCIDPSLASDDLSLIPYGYTDINKKTIQGTLGNRLDLKKNKNEDKRISNATTEKGSSLSGRDVQLFSPQSPGILIENTAPAKGVASKKIGIQRRSIGIKRISKSNHPLKDASRSTSLSDDRRSKTANCHVRTTSKVDLDNMGATLSSDFDGRCEPGETVKGNTPDLDNMIDPPASNKILPSESVRQDTSRAAPDNLSATSSSNTVMHENIEAVKGNISLQNNLIDSPASDKVSSAEPTRIIEDAPDNTTPEPTSFFSASAAESTGASESDIAPSYRSKVCNIENQNNEVTSPDEGISMKEASYNAASCNEDYIMSNNECFDIEFVEKEPDFESSGRHDLEESCILVEGGELQGTKKHVSYKKRIREALSSKLRSRKDERLLSLHKGELKPPVRVLVVGSDEHKVSARDSVEELDWEIL